MLGTCSLGSIPLATRGSAIITTPPERTELDLRVIVGGVDVSGIVMLESFKISDEINNRPTANFRLVSVLGNLHVEIGAPVYIYYQGIVRFGGQVDEIEEEVPDNCVAIWIDVTCTGWACLFDRHLVNHIWENTLFEDCIKSIITTYSGSYGESLSNDGITYGLSLGSPTIAQGPRLGRIVFKNQTAAECIDKLCEMAGFSWWVTPLKVFYCADSASVRAPYPLDEVIHGDWGNTTHKISRDDYRNIQLLEGGKTRTPATTEVGARTEKFIGDGKQKTWGVTLPLAAKPRIFLDSVEVSADDIWIRELNEEADWFYEIDSNDINQNTSDDFPAIEADVEIKIIYQGYYPIVEEARNLEEIAARKKAEGGTGTYKVLDTDDKIDDADLASELVQGLLKRKGMIPRNLTCTTTTPGYQAGQLVPVRAPEYQIEGDWLIQRVEWEFLGWSEAQPFRYTLDVINGQPPGGWADFYRRAQAKGRVMEAGENEKIHVLYQSREVVVVSDTLHPFDGDVTPTLFDNFMMFYIYGLSSIGHQRQNTDDGLHGNVGGPLYGATLNV